MRVGVSGHRQVARLGPVGAIVDGVLARLAREGEPPHVIVSSIAEGADRLVAHCGLRQGWALEVILPLSRDDYATDFEIEESRAEFEELLTRATSVTDVAAQPSREESYLRAGRAIVERADVVLALWDGHPARGRGGTAEIVAYTRLLQRPLVWIEVSRPDPTVHVESLGLPEPW